MNFKLILSLVCPVIAYIGQPSLGETSLEEEIVVSSLPIEGTIPEWLSGTLVRNGPAKFEAGDKPIGHWLDGLAMLHAFSFQNGKVSYANKFLRTTAYRQVFEKGSMDFATFAADPCKTLFKQFFTFFLPKQKISSVAEEMIPNANVNIAKIADEYVALTEIPLPVVFDPYTLDTLGLIDYKDHLPTAQVWESAHPHIDCETKEMINYMIRFGGKSSYDFYRIEAGTKTRQLIASIPVAKPAYMHSFSITKNYIILTEYPYVVNPLDLKQKKGSFISHFNWKPKQGTRFLVIDRHTGELVKTVKTRAFFSFHHANAYEVDDSLFVDIMAYQDPSIITQIASLGSPRSAQAQLIRFNLSLQENVITEQLLCDLPLSLEFPRFNETHYEGKEYSYLYTFAVNDKQGYSLCKINTKTKETLTWSEEGCSPGEAIFIPAPEAKDEDDGVVLTIVLDAPQKTSFLLVLDGKTFKELGRARVPHHIPNGLHGQFFPEL